MPRWPEFDLRSETCADKKIGGRQQIARLGHCIGDVVKTGPRGFRENDVVRVSLAL